jgi:hypothetical protein
MGMDGEKFLFRQDWTAAQAFFSLVGRVPADKAGFLARYGPFENEISVEGFTGALREVNLAAGELGSPDSLKRRLAADSQYLLRPNPPDEVYASIVWLSMQAGNVARTISSTFELLPNLLQSAGAGDQERAQRAKQVLAGDGGLVSAAVAIAGTTRQIAEKLASYGPRLTRSILTFHDTEVVNQANRVMSEMKSDIVGLQKQAGEASEKAKGWFGADKANEEYERLQKEIASRAAEIERKGLLDADLGDFFVTANKAVPGLLSAVQRLRDLEKMFQDIADKIGDTCKLASPEQLGDPAWLARSLNFPTEIERWKEFQSAAQNFTQGALVGLDR